MRALVAALLLVLVIGACSDDPADEGEAGGASTTTSGSSSSTETTAPPRDIPDGPAAVLTPIEGGGGTVLASAADGGAAMEEAGYTQAELQAAGTASSYASDGPLPADGLYDLRPAEEADYATRVLVRRPAEAEAFNGTVVVEWLNVSAGADSAPDYTYMADEILRGGYAWVGVSAQRIGIEGGPVAVSTPADERAGAGRGLKAIDPDRYGDLVHPGDAFAYDIFSQVGRAARAAGDDGPLAGLDVTQVLAIGESQSAFALTTYANGVQPLAGVYDGLLIHSRGGASAPLGEPGGYIDIGGSLGGEPTPVRPDLDVPTMIVQTEGDVLGLLGYLPARQDDSETVRLWEIAGAAHADRFQIGEFESELGCPTPINRGQQAFVLRAALRHLATWAAGGEAPPEADRVEVEGDAYVLDDVGNVRGGVRTPVVDAPVEVLSGLAPEGAAIICALLGSTTPLDDATLAGLYADADAYRQAYAEAADAAIAAGFVLADDRDALLAEARTPILGG